MLIDGRAAENSEASALIKGACFGVLLVDADLTYAIRLHRKIQQTPAQAAPDLCWVQEQHFQLGAADACKPDGNTGLILHGH